MGDCPAGLLDVSQPTVGGPIAVAAVGVSPRLMCVPAVGGSLGLVGLVVVKSRTDVWLHQVSVIPHGRLATIFCECLTQESFVRAVPQVCLYSPQLLAG